MRIVIASGKGGAGKTTVTASLAYVWDSPCVVVDADVEAPNLHLFLPPDALVSEQIFLEVPVWDQERCSMCGACRDICRFKAIAKLGKTLSFFPDMCHGCGGCFAVCPESALASGQRLLGELCRGSVLEGRHDALMGRARVGEAMTPPQLRALRLRLDGMLMGKDGAAGRDALIDAPPGISCPAMTVARDSDCILLVAEPTPFGFYDFRLAHEAFSSLGKPMAVVVNRGSMAGNSQGDEELRRYCRDQGLPLLAELPFARDVAEGYASGRIVASLSSAWKERFEQLRDALRAFAQQGEGHA